MPSYSGIAVVTNEAKHRLGEMLATGKSYRVDKFVVGGAGHDSADPTLAVTPDPARLGCYCATESITVAGGCIFEDAIDAAVTSSAFCPSFTCVLESGEATGTVSSVCLIGTVVYSPIAGDPEVGTEFLFAIFNTPIRVKGPGDRFEYNIDIQL